MQMEAQAKDEAVLKAKEAVKRAEKAEELLDYALKEMVRAQEATQQTKCSSQKAWKEVQLKDAQIKEAVILAQRADA